MGRLKRAGQALLGTALETEARSLPDWYMSYFGQQYPFAPMGSLDGKEEKIHQDYEGLVAGAFQQNGVIFACMEARRLLFSQARFQWTRFSNGSPGDLFGTQALDVLEAPDGPGTAATTSDLLSRAMQDYDLAGNWFAYRSGDRMIRLEPEWVTIIRGQRSGSPVEWELVGYVYTPGGPASGNDPVSIPKELMVHWAAAPDPLARYRGMSWLRPVVNEIMGDNAAMMHKLKFFENGATVNTIAVLPAEVRKAAFDEWVAAINSQHQGAQNAYKMMFLGAGADVKTIGADMKQIDFKEVQGHGETRICAAARIPPIIVGLSEGLESATYSNYGQARRAFADLTMRPLWQDVCSSIGRVLQAPTGANLWYADRGIPFLQEDQKDAAEILKTQSETLHTLIIAGWNPDSAKKAVTEDDLTLLKHSGLFSVQLQPAGTVAEGKGSLVTGTPTDAAGQPEAPPVATNGASAGP